MKTPHDLTNDQLWEIVVSIQGFLYLDLDREGRDFWNPKKSTDPSEAVEHVRSLLSGYELAPTAEALVDQEPCACEQPGHFRSGVPGILAHVVRHRLAPEAKVERCDQCQRFPSDQAALEKLIELGMASDT